MAPKIDSPYLWVPLLLLLAAFDYVLPAVGAVLGRRWLLRAPGADRPQMKDGVAHYAVRAQVQGQGFVLGPLMGVFCVWTWLDARPATDWLALSLAILFFVGGPGWLGDPCARMRTALQEPCAGFPDASIGARSRVFNGGIPRAWCCARPAASW